MTAPATYTRRTAPGSTPMDTPPRVSSRLKGFLDVELQNIQRAFRSVPLYIASYLWPYALQPGEVGVVNPLYPYLDIRRYGAESGGAASVTTLAYQNALASVPSTGGTVTTPAGVWNVNERIDITTDDTTLYFTPGSVVNATVSGPDLGVFFAGPFTPVDRCTIAGATITGAFPWGVRIAGGSGHKVLRNTISGGTVVEGGKCGAIYVDSISNSEIGWNRCSGNGDATLNSGADIMANNGDTFLTDTWIHHNDCTSTLVVFNIVVFNPLRCQFESNWVTGARVYATATTTGGYGILLYNTVGVVGQAAWNSVVNNEVRGTEGNGIMIQNVHDTIVEGNLVDDTGSVMDDTILATAGILLEGLRGTCSGNEVYNSGRHGIVVAGGIDPTLGGHRTLVSGNQVANVGLVTGAGDGIVVTGVTIDDVSILGNVVEGVDTGSAIGVRKFSDTVPAVNLTVKGNTIRDVAATGVGVFIGTASVGAVVQNNTLTAIADPARGIMLRGSDSFSTGNLINGACVPDGMASDRGDTNVTLVASVDDVTQPFATTLSANRTVTLSATNARNGARFRVVRTGLGAFSLDVGGLKTIPASTAAFVDVEHNGAAWTLTAYGVL